MQLKSAHQQPIHKIISEAVSNALGDFPVVEILDEDDVHLPETLLVSILGFHSEKMRGTIVLGCDDEFLRQSCPGISGDEENIEAYINDWIGELSNLIMGRVKNQLMPYGIVLRLNPPSISKHEDSIFDSYSNTKPSEKVWLNSESGDTVCLLMACEIDDDIDFSEAIDKGALNPGSGVISLKDFNVDDNPDMKSATQGVKSNPVEVEGSIVEDDLDADYEVGPDLDDLDEHEVSDFDEPGEEDFQEESVVDKDYDLPSDEDVSLEMEKSSGRKLSSRSNNISPKSDPNAENEISSIRYMNNGNLEITFDNNLVFLLDLNTMYERGFRNFEMQGLPIRMFDAGLGIQVFVDGICVTVYKESDSVA